MRSKVNLTSQKICSKILLELEMCSTSMNLRCEYDTSHSNFIFEFAFGQCMNRPEQHKVVLTTVENDACV